MSDRGKVVIIGLDGACYPVFRPLVEAGIMPNLGRFLREGAWGTLHSTRPPVTCPAWPTMFTGVGPGKHGLFSFSHRDPASGRVRTAAVTDVQVPKLWELLEESGHSSAVLNVPITFPAQPIKGAMLTGFVSPDDSPLVTHPASLAGELREKFGELKLNWLVLGHRPWDPQKRHAHVRKINDLMRLRAAQFEYILDQHPCDFCYLVHEYPDRICHLYHHLLDPEFSEHDDPGHGATLDLLREGFRALDDSIGRLLTRFGPQANYLIVSDHGFGGVTKWVYVNNLLERAGLTRFKSAKVWVEMISRQLNLSVSTRQKLGVEPRELWHRQDPARAPLINFSKSVAFAGPQLEQAVYVNSKGRFQGGIVEASDYERVRAQIIDELSKARDLQTGEPVFQGVWSRDELYPGPYLSQAPDVIYELSSHYMVSNSILPQAVLRRDCLRPLRSGWDLSGYHRPEGVFMGLGPAFAPVGGFDASILDITPTVLHLMDVPIPSYMDGSVIRSALKDGSLNGRVRHDPTNPRTPGVPENPYSEKEQLEVARRLEELGYL